MEVQQTTTLSDQVSALTATAPEATSSASAESKSILSSDFQTFLTMLSTQIQNQDPLNPMDSTEFAVQLATFSSVEQQVLTNNLLESMLERVVGGDVASLANWIGLEVPMEGRGMLRDGPLEIIYGAVPSAASAELVITDEDGAEVARKSISVSAGSFAWDGTDSAGAALPSGAYGFDIEFFDANGFLTEDTAAIETYGEVMEARIVDGATTLVLIDGSTLPSMDVTSVRRPASSN